MHISNISLTELWKLEVSGISDPTVTIKENYNLYDYSERMKILPDGRYEVERLWKK